MLEQVDRETCNLTVRIRRSGNDSNGKSLDREYKGVYVFAQQVDNEIKRYRF